MFELGYHEQEDQTKILPLLEPGYRQSKPGLLRIQPYAHDPNARPAIDFALGTLLAGNFRAGDNVVIEAQPQNLEMACEIAHALGTKVNTTIIYLPNGPQMDALLRHISSPDQLETLWTELATLYGTVNHRIVPWGIINHSPAAEALDGINHYTNVYGRRYQILHDRVKSGDLRTWAMIACPTPDEAQNIGMSFEEYRRLIFDAIFASEQLAPRLRELKQRLAGGKELSFRGPNCNLTATIEGRPLMLDTGYITDVTQGSVVTNHPSAELFVSPMEGTGNGRWYSNVGVMFHGGLAQGFDLTIKDGLIAERAIGEGQQAFDNEFDWPRDPTRRVLAEMAIVANPVLARLIPMLKKGGTRNPLVDEKLGYHTGYGNNQHMGGNNNSPIHDDVPTDEPIEFYLDGKRVQL